MNNDEKEVYIDNIEENEHQDDQVMPEYSDNCNKHALMFDLYKITEEDGSVSQFSNSVFFNSGRFHNPVDQKMIKRQQSIKSH